MQLTRFDRWLREKFAYETHIQTLRLPERVPPGIRVIELPEAPGKRYRYLFIARRPKQGEKLIDILRENGQMYETKIVDRKGLMVRIFVPKDKSFSWKVFSFLVISAIVVLVLLYVKSLVEDPKFRQNFMEALEILKG